MSPLVQETLSDMQAITPVAIILDIFANNAVSSRLKRISYSKD